MWWLFARVGILASTLAVGLTPPTQPIDADWQVGLGTGVVGSIAFTVWLLTMRRRSDVIVSAPFSIYTPFFPIGRYPVRAWRLSAFAILSGGAAGLFTGTGNAMLDRTMIALGLPLLATTLAWSWSGRPKSHRQ